jgi:hypothetical protein
MAKHYEQWLCEFCDAPYLEKKFAEECEQKHSPPETIVRCSGWSNGEKYPLYIEVKMKDGYTIEFKR